MVIVVRFVFHEGNKYYSQDFLDKCFYKLQMLYFDSVSEGIDVDKISESKECIICSHHYFLDKECKFQSDVCNGRQDVLTTF